MSDFPLPTQSLNRPEHHLHDSTDPLPGTKGISPAPDYSPETMERLPSSAFNDQPQKNWNETSPLTNRHSALGGVPSTKPEPQRQRSAEGTTAFTDDRPMNVKPAPTGGVAINGQDDLPEGKASMTDKLVGKTQKVIGKLSHKPEMHEKGELRESGGKAAVRGQARAPHD
ncbi:hypothetical protein BD779DRAFT_1516622 [Infundibulicybe gibba]|nr:hypothetical protein BD779DRAFT_1516622 [Infundibulicybe gibba]